jgi:tripartite-type tricarboxylate transporter receptor subunit TctC
MRRIKPIVTAIAVVLAALAASTSIAGAQDIASYPSRPIRLVTPEVPGSATDILARIFAQRLSAALHQDVVIDNIFGAPGIAAGIAAAPDGYTLLYGSAGTLALLPHIKKVSFDPFRDLVPVSRFVISPTLLAVHPSVPATTVKELIALLKANPDKLRMSTAGYGTAGHFAGVMFLSMAGVHTVTVHYDGGGPAIKAVIDNDAQWTFAPIAGRLPHVRTGEIRAIATGGSTRLSMLPDVPTVAESGLPGYDSVGWGGIFMPVGTPQPIVDKLNATIVKVFAAPDVKDQLAQQGSEAATDTPAELARLLREDYDHLGQVAKAIGIPTE